MSILDLRRSHRRSAKRFHKQHNICITLEQYEKLQALAEQRKCREADIFRAALAQYLHLESGNK